METRRQRGRPRKYPAQPSISEIRRKERIRKFAALFSHHEDIPKFVDKMRPPPQTICVTLALPSLLLIDLYLEYAAERSLPGNNLHHGMIIDSLVERLREDNDFSRWLSVNPDLHDHDSKRFLGIGDDG